MYRVTNNMMVNSLMMDMQNNLRLMTKYNEQIASTRIINRPSDDPGGLVKSLRLRTNINEAKQYSKNLNEAMSFLGTTDSAMDNIGQVLHRIRELMVDVSNETKSNSDMKAIGVEISQLKQQIESIANTTYGSKMVFGGLNVTEPSYQDGKWVGNNRQLLVEIGVANVTPVNITNADMNNFFTGESVNFGSDVFTFPLTSSVSFNIQYIDLNGATQSLPTLTVAPPNGVAFESLGELSSAVSQALDADATLQAEGIKINVREQDGTLILSSNEDNRFVSVQDSISATPYAAVPAFSVFNMIDKILNDIERGDNIACSFDLDLIDLKMQDLLTARALVGGRTNRLELQHSRLASSELSYNELLSKNEDTDMSEAIMMLKMQENVYRASLAAGAQIIQPTLVDYLR